MKVFSTITIAAAAATAAASSTVHRAPELCCGWYVDQSYHNSEQQISFTVHAAEKNLNIIEQIATEVSNPSHVSYGHYLTSLQIDDITAPAASDIKLIKDWLSSADATVTSSRGRTFHVTSSVEEASKLLSTSFRSIINRRTNQARVIASDYILPANISAATNIMGLHGLPLPPRSVTITGPGPGPSPANVTPAVILSQYQVSGVTPQKSSGNIQAVAEFQGQTMASKDLATFFKQYVPNAPTGADKVSKFVGDQGDKVGETEASLDIQYIMGVAPGIATEFWLYDPSDFCGDLKNWTNTLLSVDSPPLVTSVSYGWQGNLSQIGCTDADVQAVDSDFAKLAAKGITIIFASGDSGSGYSPARPQCDTYDDNTQLEGTIAQSLTVYALEECCEFAASAAGFTFDGPDAPTPPGPSRQCTPPTVGIQLEGVVLQQIKVPEAVICCEFSEQMGQGYSFVTGTNGTDGTDDGECTIFKKVTGNKTASSSVSSGTNPPRVKGNCTVFKTVTGRTKIKGKTSSSPAGPSPPAVLWPSWPASSPWVTSVGATRFVGQKAGNKEMASDQFGSGGGFSKQFGQSPNAKWQMSDVARYLNVVSHDAPFPPTGSFSAKGRATPDVSALGEGFQVYQSGRVMAVGGTSASAPTFAGIVSLLNEHRLQNGKKPLGFLNPFLYQNADAFTDVVKGTNAIGRGTGPIKYGFNCTKGWDPATGHGTPNFEKLLKAVDALK